MFRRLVLSCVLLMGWGASLRAQVPFPSDLMPTRTSLGRLGLERAWFAAVPLTGTERLVGIHLADNMLFAQTSSSNVYVYDANTGQFLWSAALGYPSNEAYEVAVNSRMAFITGSRHLYGLDRRTGRTVWRKELDALPASPTAADEQRVMLGLGSGRLIACRVEDGRTEWNWRTGGPVTARPIPAQRMVAFASQDGKVYVALADEATMLYRFATGGPISASMGTYGTRHLIVPSQDKNVYAIDLLTAEAKWSFPSGAPVTQEPLMADEDIFVVNAAGMMSNLEPASGTPRWTTSTHGGELVAVGARRVYLRSSDKDLFLVDRATGQVVAPPRATRERAGLNLREYDLHITNHLNDRLFFGTRSGLIVSLRELGEVQPRPLRTGTSQPFGFIPPEGLPEGSPVAPAAAPEGAETETDAGADADAPAADEAQPQ